MNPFTDLLDINDQESYIALLQMFEMSAADADDAFSALKAVYEQYQETFDHLYRVRHERPNHYKIIESDIGPQISQSRAMVYDVLDYQNKGYTKGEIGLLLNLKLAQIDVAFEYIEKHREILGKELAEIKIDNAQREINYRAIQEERMARARTLPMTKERRAVYNLIEENRCKRNQIDNNIAE